MIHSPVTALIWERWRRTRWVLIAAILLPFSGWLMHEADYSTLGGIVAVTWLGLGTVALTAVLLLGQCEVRNLDLAFPKRLFRFPVRTVTLLAVNMGYGVVTIALPLLIIIGLGKLSGDIVWNWWIGLGKVSGEYLWKWWIGFLWLETVFVAVQAMAWLRGAKAVFFFLAPSLTGVFTLLYLAAKFGLPMGTNILCPVIIVLCCVICFWNVSADRRGAWISGWQWVGFLFSIFRKRRTKGFASALHAQTWFEFRQAGYLFPIATLGLIGSILGVYIMILIFGDVSILSPSSLDKDIPGMLGLTAIAAWLAGLLAFAVYYRDRASGASGFWLRRPMATRTLAVARLRAMARSIAGVLAILTLFALERLARDWATGTLPGATELVPQALKDHSPFIIGVMAVLVLWSFLLACWTFLELTVILTLAALFLEAVGVVVILLFFEGDFAQFFESLMSDLARWSVYILSPGLIVGTLYTFYVTSRRKLISTSTLVGVACFFPVTVVSFWAFLWWFEAIKGWPSPMEGLIIIGAATLPFIPLVTVPLWITKLRHR